MVAVDPPPIDRNIWLVFTQPGHKAVKTNDLAAGYD